jgi:hypothetical protein
MRSMSHNQQTTIFGIVFWLLFLASIGLVSSGRWLWLEPAWFCAGWAFVAVVSVFSIVEMFKNRNDSTEYGGGPARSLQSSHYLPRWMLWVLLDDEQYAKYLRRRKVTGPEKSKY